MGLSSLCNMLACIKTAKHLGLGEEDVLIAPATSGAAMYGSEREKFLSKNYAKGFDEISCAEIWGRSLAATTTDLMVEMTHTQRERVFNLGYYTWVEQQGVTLEEFSARKSQSFWNGLQSLVPAWDAMIAKFNAETGCDKLYGV